MKCEAAESAGTELSGKAASAAEPAWEEPALSSSSDETDSIYIEFISWDVLRRAERASPRVLLSFLPLSSPTTRHDSPPAAPEFECVFRGFFHKSPHSNGLRERRSHPARTAGFDPWLHPGMYAERSGSRTEGLGTALSPFVCFADKVLPKRKLLPRVSLYSCVFLNIML